MDKLQYVVGKAEQDKVAIIRFFGSVDYYSASRFNEEFLWLQDVVKPSKIIVAINSDGGSVMYGMSVFSVIQSCPIEVDCIIEGIAASMGSVIWTAGNNSYMHDYSILMIHNPFMYNKDCEDPNVKNMLGAFKKQIETIYHKRFGLNKEKVREIMDGEGEADGTFFTASDAVKAGIIPAGNIIKTPKQASDKVRNALEGLKGSLNIVDVMNSITTEIDENKLTEVVSAIHQQNQQEQQDKNLMVEVKDKFSFETVTAQLGMGNDAPVANVTNRIADLLNAEASLKDVNAKYDALKIQFTGKETEVKNLNEQLTAKDTELQKYKDAEKAAKDTEIRTMVQNAADAGKIEKEAIPNWIEMANNNLELTRSTLNSIPARDKISTAIAADPENVKDATETLKTAEQKMAEQVQAVVGDIKLQTF